jgi:hypothetical protein
MAVDAHMTEVRPVREDSDLPALHKELADLNRRLEKLTARAGLRAVGLVSAASYDADMRRLLADFSSYNARWAVFIAADEPASASMSAT